MTITITKEMITNNLTGNMFSLDIVLPNGAAMLNLRKYFTEHIVDMYVHENSLLDPHDFSETLDMEKIYDAMGTDIEALRDLNKDYDFTPIVERQASTLEEAQKDLEFAIEDALRSRIAIIIRETVEIATGFDISLSAEKFSLV